ncbi:MAG: type II secretion system GspH family protein [Defluviitaleaceae bacterium]|nr:type II secretion system GspH family protein [Defluviitaleaceae bacterium]
MNKNQKGFTLVELIVVIAVLALLAVGAVIAFQGIQANARRATLTSDANALASALNAANSTLAARGGTLLTAAPAADANHRITITVAAAGGLTAEVFFVDFETANHAARATAALTFINPPTGVTGAAGTFVLNTTAIQGWNTQDTPTL